ncbi:feruloyl-CoA synthase [Pusillimonas sp. DMV24BSW_D]|uniref:feruloyl-CoA synthase n=1 Tax=Neopusillimonas aestuarii TaxID=2716226 RepID=UPI00140D175C|nr:feruloyl-CoA synthase [Pusillimonas sp. DMV24BSW_D]QIM47905.1 feruloyl-CoA synthase [Pusillimonas sp. DMV24BSW_D]
MSFLNNPHMLATPNVVRHELGEGAFVLSNPEPLGEIARCVGEWLEHWALKSPNALFLAERDSNEQWVKLTYFEVRQHVGRLAQGLLNMRLPRNAPVVALSDPGIDQALLMLACLYIGRPFSTVSSAYSRVSKDYLKLKAAFEGLRPGLVYASDGELYQPAIGATVKDCPVLLSEKEEAIAGSISFSDLLHTEETVEVMHAFNAVTPETHAKYMLTSGSTGKPKIVINTHRMLCANQKQIQIAWPFLKHEKPILVSWLPWSHTFGTNYNFNMVLCNGGSFYFDEGKPLPGLIEKSVRNYREIQPNLFLNIPRGFDVFLSMMESDPGIARDCFARLRAVFYAGAALTQSTWEQFNAAVEKVVGDPVMFSSSLGSTETSPVGTYVHWLSTDPRCVGLPVADMQIKFLPNGDKLEVRMKGPQVFPGYLNDPEKTDEAFDEDGFYKIGDAAFLIDSDRPEKGIAFNGRVAEDFKLNTGTWVSVGSLRVKAVSALAPYAQDVVVTGHDRDCVGLLIFATPKANELGEENLREHIKNALRRLHQETVGGLSLAPKRAIVLREPPCVESGEITDKGYINQRLVLMRRADMVERLYSAEESDFDVVVM